MKIPFYRSVFWRMIAAVSFSFLAILSGSFAFLYASVSDSLKERTDAEKIQSFRQLGYNIDTFCQDVERLTGRLISETALTDMVYIGKESPGTEFSMRAAYFRELGQILEQYQYVESICFYNAEGLVLSMDGRQNIIQGREQDRGIFYEEKLEPFCSGQKSDFWGVKWFGGYTNNDFFPALNKDDETVYYLSACRPMYWGSYQAWVVVNVSLDYFTDIYNSDARGGVPEELTYIVDAQGQVISHPLQEALGRKREGDWRREEADTIYSFEENGCQVLCYPLTIAGWTMIDEMPLEAILEDTKGMQVTFLATIAVAICLVVFFSVFWVNRLVRPLRATTEALRRMEGGELEIAPLEGGESRDEIGLLVRQFNRMTGRIEGLVEENAAMEKKKREMEIQALKSQLNPHFLYNTLNTVKWMAVMKGEKDIVDCLDALGDILRPMYQGSSPFWSLAEEIDYIEDYGRVMRHRYGGQARLILEPEEDTLEASVPKFVLQPLVENAFLYGRREEGAALVEIRVDSKKEGDILLVVVADNGNGIGTEALEALRGNIRMGKKTAHIGLSNVNDRIRLLCGERYGLEIDSAPDRGFAVMVHLPYRDWENEKS
ncbi:sensor histidine kinase [uncultured Acetatifactor sp.]|mgnify:CR=1 FL=1|uniref:cache domain-containing sensor histidine kinase n=1 Tax=uncultured Acetatifactor sp. TaxID=1671927 RepID=UPI00261D0E2C|nr:sensor histidine kinase [uncultured Acetatifactor sp.]